MGLQLISQFKLIFWDFDGVIKDSVEVKTRAFVKLFEPFGAEVAERVREHHVANGGMSRFDKLPIYLQWAGEKPSQSRVSECCDQFGQLVLQGVINAPWVPGVEAYIRSNPFQQIFVLVSATPQDELEQILRALNLTACFTGVFGAPTRKKDAIRMTIAARGLDSSVCLMIGDARADLEAAEANHILFILRRHETNSNAFADYAGPSIKDFTAL
jgi:phosphoglycolate phosphatase-like HAD superfamily hydrolase